MNQPWALWRQSRPLQKKPDPRQGRRSRVDPFEAHADLIPQWLEAEADVGSQELLDRLIALDPERYGPQHKRTLQRRIRDWRVAKVQLMPGERSSAGGNQARDERKGVTKRQSKWVTNY